MKSIYFILGLAIVAMAYDSPPAIITHPKDSSSDARVPLKLKCEADGIPAPVFTWKLNGSNFEISENERASLEGGNLIINEPGPADNGVYQCFATNRLGTAISKKAKVEAAYMLRFKDSSPSEVQATEGQHVKLKCGAVYGPPKSAPEALVYWTDDNPRPAPILPSARVNQDSDMNLVFANVELSDTRGYYCTVQNFFLGESQRSPRVDLEVVSAGENGPSPMRPVLQDSPGPSVTAMRTGKVTLKCLASGYPTPAITWKRNDEQLLADGERIMYEGGGQELIIDKVVFEDAGRYTCEATNSEGTTESETQVSVDSVPYYPSPPADETKGPGETVLIECRAHGVPAPTVTVLVNGQPWEEFEANSALENRWTVVTGGQREASVSITDLKTTDSNVIQCLASNVYSEELASVVLNIISIPARILTYSPSSGRLTAMEGGQASFGCNVEGIPTPQLSWIFKGTTLAEDAKHAIDNDAGTLTVNNLEESDSGRYECVVTNTIDGQQHSDSSGATLTVLAKTVIETAPADHTVREGGTATFQCEISKDPDLTTQPVIYWKKGDQRLEAQSDGSLILNNVQVSKSGDYTCVVETTVEEGTVEIVNSTATLTVEGRPSPPTDLDLRSPRENSLLLVLHFTKGSDNNSPITNFIVEYDTIWPDHHWVRLTEAQPQPELENSVNVQLEPFVQYSFRIIAQNAIGDSRPSVAYNMSRPTLATEPRSNPTGVTGSSTDPRSLVIRWDRIHPYNYAGANFEYLVRYRKKGTTEWTEKTVAPPTTYLVVNASKPYEEFDIMVSSQNDEGEGPVIAEPQTGHSGEAAPASSPDGVSVEVLGPNSLNVTWQPIPAEDANGVLLGYVVTYNRIIASGQEEQQCTKSPCIVGGLQPFSTYDVQVRAYTAQGRGPPSATIRVKTEEAAPGGLDMTAKAYSERIVLAWKEPLEPNGQLLGYKITIAPMQHTGESLNFTIGPDEPLYLRIGNGQVQPETDYHIKVVAYNGRGEGIPATEERTTKLAGKPSKPKKPMVASGTDHANVTWDLASINPTPINMSVAYRKKGDKDYMTTAPVDVLDATQIMLTSLEPKTTYEAQLRTKNYAGATNSEDAEFTTAGTDTVVDGGFMMGTWLIALICIIILLILILLIICIIKSQKGGKYNVSDKEKQLKNDIESTPLKDDTGFDEYKPPGEGEGLGGSQGSLESEPGSSESDSLKEYADGDPGKFDEEGSFIGQYGDNKKQRPAEEGEQGGAAFSTFV
ncbi:neuronal cell adhesion molecule-like isoform X2 [Diadema antillarum]|uniref:neuronal cell adhesion molecule-like isoform X2 n=1 Tax=Diadema antillarum TaxID=105358 RepID=UPI003A85D7B4